MTAGPELDKLVAEKILGLDGKKGDFHPPCFSTLIQDAWLVVEHMAQGGYALFLQYQPSLDTWECRFIPSHAKRYASVLEKTAPLAICSAAVNLDLSGLQL